MAKPDNLYSEDFHADRDARTRATARTVLGMVASWTGITSVCDVGCGVGTWLAAAGELGASRLQGFEGPWGRTAKLVVDQSIVTFGDLERPIRADGKFDLVISLEVAEHLTESRAPAFVEDLCALGDLVLFSAAIPNQGGTGHVNERWQSWWAGLFAERGYDAFDAIRPAIWSDPSVAWWYRQNILLYARRGSAAAKALTSAGIGAPQMLDVVHPGQFAHLSNAGPARAIKLMVRRWLSRAA